MKLKSKWVYITVGIAVVLCLGVVMVCILTSRDEQKQEPFETEKNESVQTEAQLDADKTDTGRTDKDREYSVPIPELDDGNEIYLDRGVLDKLQEMEDAGEEDTVNLIFDTMFLLINEFVDRDYSALALCQIQRFYFTCRTDIEDMEFETLCNKIGECIPADGINKSTFLGGVQMQFGIGEDADFDFVFDAEVAA